MLETKQSLEYPEYVDRFEDVGGAGGNRCPNACSTTTWLTALVGSS